MNYALIGCGRISTNHIKAAVDNNLNIVAVCDLVPQSMEMLLAKHGLEKETKIARYLDYKDMLSKENIDMIAIATESGNHASIALDCIDAGVNLIIEKPIALSIADADEIIKRSQEKKVKVCACHQNRFNISVQHIRKAIEQKRFGKMSHGTIHVRWNRNKDYYTQAPWRGTWRQDGGALMNQSIHGIDILRWMMGDEVEEVFAYTKNRFHPYIEAEDIGLAVVKFKNGAIGTIEGTTNIYPQNLEETLYLFGETGTIKAGGKSLNAIDSWQFADIQTVDAHLNEGFEETTENVYGNGHTSVYADMMDAVKNGRNPYIDAEAGKRAMELVLAIYQSSRTSLPVKLPLENISTADFR